jgi:acyl carrier protein
LNPPLNVSHGASKLLRKGLMQSDPANRALKLIAEKVAMDPNQISMDSRLLHDLGIDGDDATELLWDISQICGVDISGFGAAQYFRGEPTLLSLFWFLPSQKRNRIRGKRSITVGKLVEAAKTGCLHS